MWILKFTILWVFKIILYTELPNQTKMNEQIQRTEIGAVYYRHYWKYSDVSILKCLILIKKFRI